MPACHRQATASPPQGSGGLCPSQREESQGGLGQRRATLLGMGTAVGIYDLRRLQIERCGGLRERALLAPDCCPVHAESLAG